MPALRWDAVPGAASYEVNVARYTSGICDWVGPGKWNVKTAVPFWTPLGNGGGKPYSDPMPVSSDSVSLAAGQEYCARVRAHSDRDHANDPVYGDYTYINGTGKAFTFLGYPDREREGQDRLRTSPQATICCRRRAR